MSKRYNARNEQAQGRMTHDDLERPMDFGPGRDSKTLAKAVSDLLYLATDSEGRLLERTKWGKQYRMPSGFAGIVGIKPSATTDHSPGASATELATVHDTLSGIVRYVGTSALQAEEIIPDLRQQLGYERPQAVKPAPPAPAPAAPELQAA